MIPSRRQLLPFAILLLTACGISNHQTRFVHANADLGAIKTVAVLPFDSLAQDRTSGDKVQKIFYLELLAMDVFQVSEPGQVTKLVRSSGISTDALSPADYQKIGKELGVDGIFAGSVVDYGESHSGSTSAPEITIQVRLVETHSGTTIWSVGQTRSGTGLSARLFGVGGESLTEATRRLVRRELGTLLK